MITKDNVTLRPLELADIDTLYAWDMDITNSYYSGWISERSRTAYQERWENQLRSPRKDLIELGIEVEGRLVGFIQLGLIDMEERRAAIGIVIGEAGLRGKGIGAAAVRQMCDFAFTVKGLERVYAECYGFNARAQRMFVRAGFQPEGVLRKHERHNGERQDMHVFGILREEFYARNETVFRPAA